MKSVERAAIVMIEIALLVIASTFILLYPLSNYIADRIFRTIFCRRRDDTDIEC
jgi:hypothetical protein